MKFYYDNAGTPTEISTSLVNITPIQQALDTTPRITVTLVQTEGDDYTTYEAWQGKTVYVMDDTATYYFFIGRISSVQFEADKVILVAEGLTSRLRLTPFTHNYLLAACKVADVNYDNGGGADVDCLHLVEDSDAGADFGWIADEWNSGQQNVGACVTDNTGDSYEEWVLDNISDTLGTWALDPNPHVLASAATEEDDLYCGYTMARLVPTVYPLSTDYRLGGTDIPDTSQISKVTIKWRIQLASIGAIGTSAVTYFRMLLRNAANDGTFLTLLSGLPLQQDYAVAPYVEGETVLTNDLTDFVHETHPNFDNLTIRFEIGGVGSLKFRVDYLYAKVEYATAAFTPNMVKVTDSGVNGSESWIICDTADFSTMGVAVADKVFIGQNTTTITNELMAEAGLGLTIDAAFDKYIAANLKGQDREAILKRVCNLEGAQWAERYNNTHATCYTSLYRPANFPATAYTASNPITHADYGHNFHLELDDNQVKTVHVWGNSKYSIYAKAVDNDPLNVSEREETIIDETLATSSDAQAVADAILAQHKTRRKSYVVTVFGTGYEDIWPGTTVYAEFRRPKISDPPTTISPWEQDTATLSYEGTFDGKDDVIKFTGANVAGHLDTVLGVSGTITFYWQLHDVAGPTWEISFKSAGTTCFTIYNLGATLKLYAQGGTTTEIASPAADTWYKITISWDSGTDLFSVWVDDVLKAENKAYLNAGGALDQISITGESDTAYISYPCDWVYTPLKYEIRRVDRAQGNNGKRGTFKTTIYLGLGQTPEGEALYRTIHDAKTDIQALKAAKLIPGTEGGLPVINHSDIQNKNAEAAYRHATTTQVTNWDTHLADVSTFHGFSIASKVGGDLLSYSYAASVYAPIHPTAGVASYVLTLSGSAGSTASPVWSFPTWAASAYSEAFLAYSVGSTALTQAYVAQSTASTHMADTTGFHGFNIASKVGADLLFWDYTSSTVKPLHPSTASYVLSISASTGSTASLVWVAPPAGLAAMSITWRDAAQWDYSTTASTLTKDTSWHTKDASAIIAAGATNVILEVYFTNECLLRTTGHTNTTHDYYITAAHALETMAIVELSASLAFDYNTASNAVSIHIIGWF